MSQVELSDALFADLAGWDAVKQARSLLANARVLSSDWQPPLLKGIVQEGTASYRAGLVLKSRSDADNLCPCRASRQWGMICAHSVAVGLHYLRSRTAPAPVAAPAKSAGRGNARESAAVKRLRRAGTEEDGEPLEVQVILSPNLPQALARGQTMVCLEGKWRRGRSPLDALPLDVPFAVTAEDARVIDALETLAGGSPPGLVQLTAQQLEKLLPALVGHPRVTLGKAQPLDVQSEPRRVAIRATLAPSGEIVLSLASTPPAGLIPGSPPWVLEGRTLRPLGWPSGCEGLLAGPIRVPRGRVPQFLNLDWPQLAIQGDLHADFGPEDFSLETATPRFKLHLAGGLAMLQAKLECRYADLQVQLSAAPEEPLWFADPTSPRRYRTRDLAAERAALASLARAGFSGPDTQGLYHLRDQDRVLRFFACDYPRLERAWEVTLDERLDRSTRRNLERLEPRFQITPAGERWFDLGVAYTTSGGERFDAADIQRLLRSGQSHTRLKNGKFALLDTGAVEELDEVLRDCAPEQHAQGYRLDNAQAGFLEATLRQQPTWPVQSPATWRERAAQQRGDISLKPPPLGPLEPLLRSYQKHGVAWLQFLRANGFSGVLADDMGLGKTVQVLAFFASLTPARSAPPTEAAPASSALGAPHFVVCPTSLVFHWAAEAQRWAPWLRVLILHGPQRHTAFAQIPAHDLVLSTYALVRRDAENYRPFEFDTLVLDEAQHIKNRQTQNALAVKAIRARHRLVLTGTPIENSVLDLWSIFDFLMPGYLGSATDFRERYEVPIAREHDAAALDRLGRRLRPFMLRRLKREVASELPEKIEQVSYCELNDDQRALYQQVLEATRRELLDAGPDQPPPGRKLVVLTALLRLRQICCDPRLLPLESDSGAAAQDPSPARAPYPATTPPRPDQTPPLALATPASGSGKLDLFLELLEEVLDGGHRVLVFSQFTRMLALLREHLSAQGVAFCYLDGATQDRAAAIGQFQQNAAIPVFLISLKAGGVGLNLVGADTVIHFDPWWNPAVEAQATDRAHRIGQKRVVTSYKLITRGTVEEKILSLQSRKRALHQGLLGGEEHLVDRLSWDEILDLLAE
ncbi:MAG: DEAD/DEAH box helicase [Verrucomicrobia bacterium]|nr:DEAD/DEAH box helicase [Verrucomicrobiota bacterium]